MASASSVAIATRISADGKALGVAAQNAANVGALLSTAESGLSNVSRALEELKSLATLAQSGALGPDELAAVDAEFQSLVQEIDAIASTTQFNGQRLLDGSSDFAGGVNVQLGASAQNTSTVTLNSVTAASLGLAGVNVSNPANAAIAQNAVDAAIGAVAAERAQVGATASSISFRADVIGVSQENAEASVAALIGADVGASVNGATTSSVLNAAAISAVEKQNAQRRSLLALLQ